MISENLFDHIFKDSVNFLSPLKITLFSIGQTNINTFDIFELLIILIISIVLSRLSEASINRLAHKYGSLREESVSMLGKIVRWGIVIIGMLIGLSVIGLPVTHFAIFVSALSVGIGFGLQTIVNNSVAGLILMSERAVSIGDIIRTPEGDIGRVNMVTIRATRIETKTGQNIIIPNASLINKDFTNYSLNPRGTRRTFNFSVPYGSDIQKVKRVIEEAAIAVPYCIPPDKHHEVECGISGFGDFGINCELVVWINPEELMEPYRLEASFLNAINNACTANDIVIPSPYYTININKSKVETS
ncbi:MAG: mechanosensitive ion channel [Burkholderiaceae bacterium]|nr:mechanosensitive ion channel [Burkholderiaceae bacterium]